MKDLYSSGHGGGAEAAVVGVVYYKRLSYVASAKRLKWNTSWLPALEARRAGPISI